MQTTNQEPQVHHSTLDAYAEELIGYFKTNLPKTEHGIIDQHVWQFIAGWHVRGGYLHWNGMQPHEIRALIKHNEQLNDGLGGEVTSTATCKAALDVFDRPGVEVLLRDDGHFAWTIENVPFSRVDHEYQRQRRMAKRALTEAMAFNMALHEGADVQIGKELRNARREHHIDDIFTSTGCPIINIPAPLLDTVIGRMAQSLASVAEMPLGSVFLSTLAAASATAATNFRTSYNGGDPVPLGIYTVAEQPPSAQKSRVVNKSTGQHKELIAAHNHNIEEINATLGDDDARLPHTMVATTNTTSAGLDQALSHCDSGRAFISSAEQGAFKSLFPTGDAYSSDNDLALGGWTGDYVATQRKGRTAFTGHVQLAIAIFAQPGAIGRVLRESDGSGLTERFLFAAEPSRIGSRTFAHRQIDDGAYNAATRRCFGLFGDRVKMVEGEPVALTALSELAEIKPTKAGYEIIRRERQRIEPQLAQLLDDGENTLVGWLGKLEAHVLKIAAVLHVFDTLAEPGRAVDDPLVIPDDTIKACIQLFTAIGEHYRSVLHSNGESGQPAEAEAVINLLATKALTKTAAASQLRDRAPFISRGRSEGYQAAQAAIAELLDDKVLMEDKHSKKLQVAV